MALNTNGLNALGNGLASVVTHMSAHKAAPDGNGSGASVAARQPVTLSVAGGVITVSDANFTGGEAGGPVVAFGFWSGPTGGTYYGSQARETGDAAFNAAGEFSAQGVTLNLTSAD